MKNRIELPLLSTDQLCEMDRLLIEEYGIEPLQTLENAGRNLAWLARQLLDDDILDRPIVVLAGQGSNGGRGLAAARHLLNWGAWVQIVLTSAPSACHTASRHQLATLQAMEAPLAWAEEGWELPPADLVIDALIGTGLSGNPHGKVRDLIHLANSSVAPILSLDGPSGLDVFSGELATPHIRAAATMCLGLPKVGLLCEPGRNVCGDLYLADTGIPLHLYARFGLATPIFARDPMMKIDVIDGKTFLME